MMPLPERQKKFDDMSIRLDSVFCLGRSATVRTLVGLRS